ncbi:mucin-associated surface protein (MASP), putative [Trypanosoma cruzi]|uniref:Mucin-associated surface protein (MASP), putative n=1 Tax=Trypanosoma cruzi (strain CL Brener) TaxID=353153 RepID=Q4DUV2_TRYCC|nr:mucin-associated surface protein (MASP), putative [Trypanosoma cruzi]EAN96289.1 mucin-associated surface protein (MASP), putative [Trypanosoma cruzi]|eukprot:XP_818140.1 mucin-associated surface protein (MASP) [Trypanosoma cruzi strain CL Brener]
MAMMMTGRVLLVCALCVLWCGAGGGGCDETTQASPSGSGGGTVVGTGAGPSGGADNGLVASEPNGESEGDRLEGTDLGQINSSPRGGTVGLDNKLAVMPVGSPVTRNQVLSNEALSLQSPPSPKPSAPELQDLPEGPPLSGGSQGGEADNAVGGVGPSGSSSGSGVKSMVSASFSACTLSPPNPVDWDVLQGGKGTTATLSMDSSEKSVKSQSAEPPAPAQPNLDRQEASTSNAEDHSPVKPHTAGNQVVNGGATGKENTQRAAVTGGPSSDTQPTTLQPAPQEQPKTELIIVPAGKERATDPRTREKEERDSKKAPRPPPPASSAGGTPAAKDLQISVEEMHQTSPSETQKLLLGQETPSKDDAEDQNTEGTATSDSVKDEAASSLVETTAPPISTSGGADTKSVASEDADNAQQPNHKEAHKDPEPQNTSPAFTATEALPQTAIPLTTAPTNDTTTPGDSDGSTAVSHTTSPPLLLLVVACAAAAAVVAA